MPEKFKTRLRKNSNKKGFTLVELMVGIAIFVIFLGMVSQSYLSIIRTQQHANGVRKMYSEVRVFMDTLAEDIRLSSIDYDCYEGGQVIEGIYCVPGVAGSIIQGQTNVLSLVKKDGLEKTIIKREYDHQEEKYSVKIQRWHRDEGSAWAVAPGYEEGSRDVFSDILEVDYLSFAIFPDVNPYSRDHYADNAAQFQPKVTVFLGVSNAEGMKSDFNYDFQTTISSRVYGRAI